MVVVLVSHRDRSACEALGTFVAGQSPAPDHFSVCSARSHVSACTSATSCLFRARRNVPRRRGLFHWQHLLVRLFPCDRQGEVSLLSSASSGVRSRDRLAACRAVGQTHQMSAARAHFDRKNGSRGRTARLRPAGTATTCSRRSATSSSGFVGAQWHRQLTGALANRSVVARLCGRLHRRADARKYERARPVRLPVQSFNLTFHSPCFQPR